MPNASVYSNAASYLSWSSTSSVITLTENSTTLVTNSSGAVVYWTQGASSGSFANTETLSCAQGPVKKKWTFSEQSAGAARITLTVTSSGGDGPSEKGQGQGQGQGKP